MLLTLKAKFPFESNGIELKVGRNFKSSFHKTDEDGVTNFLIKLSEEKEEFFPDFIFDIICPKCDGIGHEVININLLDYEDEELIETPDEPIQIDCDFCEGRKIVTMEEINKLGEKKSKWCDCHHVKANESTFISGSWIHINCGKKIQDM